MLRARHVSLRTMVLAACLWLFTAAVAHAESVSNFSAVYTVHSDGTVDVTETITYDFADAERHGIFRTLERDHPQGPTEWYKTRQATLSIDHVLRGGETEPYQVSDGRTTEVRIGDPDVTITGEHEYELSYTWRGALSYGDEGAELYWNVVGDAWEVPLREVSVRVEEAEPGLLQGEYACYQGARGATSSCASAERGTSSVTFTATDLSPGEQLTVATELDADAVDRLIEEEIAYLPFGLGVAVAWLLWLAWWVYRVRTKDKVSGAVVAQYEPHNDYLPMYTGMLYNQSLDARDVTAGILYLAEQGFLTIKREESTTLWVFTSTDYEVTLERPISDMPSEFLQQVAQLLFGESGEVQQSVKLSALQGQATKRRNQRVLKALRKSLLHDLRANGYIENGLPVPTSTVVAVCLALVLAFGWFIFVENGVVVVMLVAIGTVTLGAIAIADRFTKKGREAQHHIEGFKRYMSVTDTRRFEFHNAPEKNPETFMQNLPYAIALGVEKQWADVFADITIPQPDWYQGAQSGTFSASAFTADIDAFSSAVSSSSVASGTQGSSGGGSAGGGGGGGGGGSW